MKETDMHYNNFNTGWKVPWHLERNKESYLHPHLQCGTLPTLVLDRTLEFGKVGLYTQSAGGAHGAVALCAQGLCGQISLPTVMADLGISSPSVMPRVTLGGSEGITQFQKEILCVLRMI